MINQMLVSMARDFKKASKENEAPIWSRLAKEATKPSIARRIINLYKIDKLTKDNDVVVFPGKVLGTGILHHKITLCCFSISNAAAKKVLDTGGSVLDYKEMIDKFPNGKGVRLLG